MDTGSEKINFLPMLKAALLYLGSLVQSSTLPGGQGSRNSHSLGVLLKKDEAMGRSFFEMLHLLDILIIACSGSSQINVLVASFFIVTMDVSWLAAAKC